MNETYFPGLEEFYNKFSTAVLKSGNEQAFKEKWGLVHLSDIHTILSSNIQGGYDSHRHTMLSASTGGSVLNIGPGMGFCIFLLTELFDSVLVAEPDRENCSLLNSIANHYQTHRHKSAREIVTFYHAGIAITDDAIEYWNTKHELMKKRKLKGSILNFTIQGAGQLKDLLIEKVSRVYLHKVLSSLSISTGLDTIISECQAFLEEDGELTWSEPAYIFEEILQLSGIKTLDQALQPLFEKNHLFSRIAHYQVFNRNQETEDSNKEKWTLINARRSLT